MTITSLLLGYFQNLLIFKIMNKNIEYIMKEITEIKKHLVDVDRILTYDDI
ncbi:MAG: hypothetical protein GW779_06120 [Candidatus Altiarchaeum hamiconexum]|uniref:Uncharacterized protein n=1 Tax=Candidatus Altarchaeum hamiconexum TaxID=1803513 RepID=A0A8J8CG79_9ARCH|nr:hypothetical protein [Candidatus Altarchaeum hamiconexum]NCN69337.1 hypothetical protein [Candidatus Altarchaeum hamiconexum]NCS91953.1 hypothetical protein [Candidatus Altarchaeum hamiconexum]NCT00862.1 hypothetical protein [Candidatus Altarchaeum hamiconexum]